MPKSFKLSLIAAAVLCAGAAQASDYVVAGGAPVRSGDGQCVRTGYWAVPSEECDPALVARALPVVAPQPGKLVFYSLEILFEFDRAELGAEGRELLDALAEDLKSGDIEQVTAIGHADAIGTRSYNAGLSERRATAVREYLVGKGVPENLLGVEGRGKAEPVTNGMCDLISVRSSHARLVECLQPDRRVAIEVAGRPKAVSTAKRAE